MNLITTVASIVVVFLLVSVALLCLMLVLVLIYYMLKWTILEDYPDLFRRKHGHSSNRFDV